MNLSLSNNRWKFFVPLVPLLFILSYMMFGSNQEESGKEEVQPVAEAAPYSAVEISDPWYLSLSEDPILALYNSLTPVQRGVVWMILMVAAWGFWKIFSSSDGSMAKNVAYALSVIFAIYLLIGLLPSFDGMFSSNATTDSSPQKKQDAGLPSTWKYVNLAPKEIGEWIRVEYSECIKAQDVPLTTRQTFLLEVMGPNYSGTMENRKYQRLKRRYEAGEIPITRLPFENPSHYRPVSNSTEMVTVKYRLQPRGTCT